MYREGATTPLCIVFWVMIALLVTSFSYKTKKSGERVQHKQTGVIRRRNDKEKKRFIEELSREARDQNLEKMLFYFVCDVSSFTDI